MKSTGHFEQVKNVDPLVVLTAPTREHIDHWVAKFPPERKRSALIQAFVVSRVIKHFGVDPGVVCRAGTEPRLPHR